MNRRQRTSMSNGRAGLEAFGVIAVLGFGIAMFSLGKASKPDCATAMAVRNTELLLCQSGKAQPYLYR